MMRVARTNARRAATALIGTSLVTACAVSTQQEVALGEDYARQIDAQLPLVQDAQVNQYIRNLGQSIANVADDRNLDWEFKIVNSEEVNAFAVPGGFVYINRGLIERADNLAQVAGVLSHEIGHVTLRHSIEQMQKAQGANVGVGVLCVLTPSACEGVSGAGIQVAGAAVFASFSREDENEADAVAVDYMVRSGYDPRGIPRMFEQLLAERRTQPSAVEAWFSTHPLTEDRIAHTEELISQYDDSRIRNLTSNTAAFESFKRRLQSLPPPA